MYVCIADIANKQSQNKRSDKMEITAILTYLFSIVFSPSFVSPNSSSAPAKNPMLSERSKCRPLYFDILLWCSIYIIRTTNKPTHFFFFLCLWTLSQFWACIWIERSRAWMDKNGNGISIIHSHLSYLENDNMKRSKTHEF